MGASAYGLADGSAVFGLGLGIIILQSVCNKFGSDQIAGFTTAMRVEQLALQPMISFGIAMAVFTAQNFGARRFDRIRDAVHRCSLLTLAFSLFAAVVVFAFGEEVIGIFLDNPSPTVMEPHIFTLCIPCLFTSSSARFLFTVMPAKHGRKHDSDAFWRCGAYYAFYRGDISKCALWL